MMKKIYRVWREKNVEASLSDSGSAGCGDFARFEDVRIPAREKVADVESCSLQEAEEAIDADVRKRIGEGEFGCDRHDDRGRPVWHNPEGEELRLVQAEYSVTEEFVKA